MDPEHEVHREQVSCTFTIQPTQPKCSDPQVVRLVEDQVEEMVQYVHGRLQDSLSTLVKLAIKKALDEYRSSSEPYMEVLAWHGMLHLTSP